MAYLYLTEQGSILRKAGDRLLVEKDDEIVLDLPYHKLENVLLFGNNPIYRGETLGTYALVFNAILNYQHLGHETTPADKR